MTQFGSLHSMPLLPQAFMVPIWSAGITKRRPTSMFGQLSSAKVWNRWAATISTLCRTRQGNDGEWLSRSRRSHCQVGSRTVISGMRQGIGATVAWSISWPFVACLRYSQPENRMPPFFCSTKECFLSFEIYREYYIMNITCTMIMYDVVIQSFIAFRFSWLCS